MSTALATPRAGVATVTSDLNLTGPIIVATDGTASASAAIKAAALMADRTGAHVTVLAVLEPLPLVAADYGLLLPPAETDEARRQALAQRVRDQLSETVGARPNWDVQVRDGDPAAVIARMGREAKARMIIAGIGHHDLLDRMFGGETALHTLRLSRVPVLAVPPGFTALPQRLAIAIDFSEPSVIAARAALALLPSVTMAYLVHVAPRLELQPEAYAAWMSDYSEGVEPAFARVRQQLEFPAGVTVETITLTGKPTKALLDFVKSAHVDAIVTGSRGAGLVDRILVGSTATGLIRGAHCAVFAVPTPLGTEPRRAAGSPDEIPEHEWADALEAFTRRNAGRIATLEVDDPEIGAQAQQHDYPFLGAAYDHNDRRIELMLGDMENTTRHLTRGIGDVRQLDLLKDAAGRDRVLRIAHGSGQTILTLAR
ncbi:MAG TPA: universal stress protein [Gemmatimonadaceae bacterium]|nr:universal stress protein [Gemmatimonadaceae bacterium]